ncbi:hypothetical protein Dsin_013198 [Dipteronia sinensis]|uniref:F-box domain-containing protein n=1 Tax=Dipteronia sinensis TaxID=43782 RepID=A0AAE0AK01_9ROSI|nr:hypothetical protein Dsin_013198 [Dipteronia sinensis]
MEELVDRISELPEPILHNILLFLPFKQVAQTCVLSKIWERTWRRYPVLEFGGTILRGDLCRPFRMDLQKKMKRRLNCWEQVLRNRCREMMSMKKFTLDMDLCGDPEFESFANRCIWFAVERDVKELRLDFEYRNNILFKLPQSVLISGSIEFLKLRSCLLELRRFNIQLSSLKTLFLSHVFLDDHMIESLVSGCPLLEDLGFDSCQGFKSLELYGLNRLNEVKVTNNDELQRLNVEELNIHFLAIFWSSPAACDINVASCKNIKDLSLSRVCMKDNWLCNLISELSILKFLSIFDCFELESFRISSPYLQELCLSGCRNLVEISIRAPNLHVFVYSGKIISLSLNALALSKIDLELQIIGFYSQWFVKCVEYLETFRSFSQVLYLRGTMDEIISVPEDLRLILPSPLSTIKHLNSRSNKTEKITKVVDDLLWISPHTTTVSIKSSNHGVSSFEFQFSYKKQVIYEGQFASCCKSHPILCWQHCIEEVKLEIIIENYQKEKNMQSYTLKGADILEQIDALSTGYL